MSKRQTQWLIEGYDGTTKIYQRRIDTSHLTDRQLRALLMTLTAKAGLTFDEIVGAFAKRRTRFANDHLTVRREGPYLRFHCGNNPYFVARIVD
ncbi:MAG TPA: hypothetical protein VJN69_11570 [Candidatus Acidoferrales bacterium]|nr:hypothetical protein [Candidatus Acidoferrales bacterium]